METISTHTLKWLITKQNKTIRRDSPFVLVSILALHRAESQHLGLLLGSSEQAIVIHHSVQVASETRSAKVVEIC